MEHLREVVESQVSATTEPARRGVAGQRQQRSLEDVVRGRAVDFWRWAQQQGWTATDAAESLRIVPRTLRQWYHDVNEGPAPLLPLGRPTARSPLASAARCSTSCVPKGPE